MAVNLMKRILFLQPAYAHYRKPLFDRLISAYNITFIFVKGQSDYPSVTKNIEGKRSIFLNAEKDWLWPFKLLRLLFFLKSNIIISSVPNSIQTLISYLVAKVKKKGLCIWTENWNFDYEYFRRPRIYQKLRYVQYRYFLLKAGAVIVHGDYSFKYHLDLGIPKEKLFIANHSSLDLSLFPLDSSLELLFFKEKKYTILYLSRIIHRKGLDILIKAFKKLETKTEGVRLLIVGDGSFRLFCQDLARKLFLKNVHFIGSVQFEKSAIYYKISDVFVLPSCLRGHSEAWGLVINEAMSMAKPIITTDAVGAVHDLVKNGFNGYVVKSANVDELYDALRKLFHDKKTRIKMGRNSRKIFEQYNNYDKMFAGFKNAICYPLKLNQ
jgi:glycosyltransferase involved in cell wall biosynthesis